jgi:hypothetical protein
MQERPARDVPKWQVWVQAFAPIYFLLFSLLRCYVETDLLAKHGFFSYYTALHHVLWFTSIILVIILLVSFLLKVPIIRLLWLMYGVTLTAIPVLYAVLTGEHLSMQYLGGSLRKIVSHIVTFCLTYPRNRPLTIELLVIFLSMIGVGYYYSRSWPRSLVLAVVVHLVGNIFAIHWFGPVPYTKALVAIRTDWSNNPLMAVIWLYPLTALAMLFMWRAGWFGSSKRSWLSAAIWTALSWMVYGVVARITGWFVRPFDIFMSGLPVTTLTFLLASILSSERRMLSRCAWATMSIVLLIQLAVMGPIYLHKTKSLIPKPPPLPLSITEQG